MTQRVLVVDDNRILALGLSDVLELWGFEPVLAHSTAEAVAAAEAAPYRLALVDVKLPDGNGLELLRRLLDLRPEAPAVLMTGYRVDQLLATVAGEGRVAVLRRATGASDLVELVGRVGPGGVVLVTTARAELAGELAAALADSGCTAHLWRGGPAPAPGSEHDVLVAATPGLLAHSAAAWVALEPRPTAVFVLDAPNGVDPLREPTRSGCLSKPFDPEAAAPFLERATAPPPGAPAGNGA